MRSQAAAISLLFCILALAITPVSAAIYRVDPTATGVNSGTSWHDAFTTIQAAIDAAMAGDEVWVKTGTYTGIAAEVLTDSFEALDSNAVDILGEESDFPYTSSGVQKSSHFTIIYPTGDVTMTAARAAYGGTTEYDSLPARLAGLEQDRDVLVFANHPSQYGTEISNEDLSACANAGVIQCMELLGPTDVAKYDYLLAHFDDQAGACSKMVWSVRSDDMHHLSGVDYTITGAMVGSIPTEAQDPVYADRRTAFVDMVRRGSTVALPKNSKCSVPAYVLESSAGTASRMQISLFVYNIEGASSARLKFYGCDWSTGNSPGTLLRIELVTLDAANSTSYYFTQTGSSGGVPLTTAQKANIKYIRPVLTWYIGNQTRTADLQPVRIRSSGAWWDGPDFALAGNHATVGPSPYPTGGTDVGETVYFNTHSHSTNSDGDSPPSVMRNKYWTNYGGLDPAKPRFDILTDHRYATPFTDPIRSVVVLKNRVAVYGGFAGNEISRDQRNWTANPTIIDGQHAARCVYSSPVPGQDPIGGKLDGFVLRNGKALYGGGGLYNRYSAVTISNCTFTSNEASYGGGMCNNSDRSLISDCTFSGNAASLGGGMCNYGWGPQITACIFSGNSAGSSGGGTYDCTSSPTISGCTFSGNTASRGGGIFSFRSDHRVLDSTLTGNTASGLLGGGGVFSRLSIGTITDCAFAQNQATAVSGRGGGMFSDGDLSVQIDRCTFDGNKADGANGRGGGVYDRSSTLTLTNCSLAMNTAGGAQGVGGGICIDSSSPALTNNAIVYNSASLNGGGIYCADSSPTIANNIIAFNSEGICRSGGSPTLMSNDVYSNSSDYHGISPGSEDISADPLFANSSAGDYHLSESSPCIDAGDNSAPGLTLYDMDNQPRIQGGLVDIGPDEFVLVLPHLQADGESVRIKTGVITAVFGDYFYIERVDRPSGIRAYKPGHGLAVGEKVEVEGTIYTNSDGERYIAAGPITHNGAFSQNPLFVLSNALGGSDHCYDSETGAGRRGVTLGFGLNNIGLLVTMTGRVTEVDTGCFYLDDGRAPDEGLGHAGVKVEGTVPVEPQVYPVGKLVRVTGISSCFKTSPTSELYRRILATDVTVLD
jgi:hypothetical protein